jgi:DNA-binding IclR family transcriptional regulator
VTGTVPGAPTRSVTGRVAAILRAFGPYATELSLTELAHRSGLPVSTTARLAGELVELGVLEPGGHRGYRIGLRLWETGSLAVRGLTLRDVAVPFMQDLYEATHENVHLAVLEGEEVLYVEKITGRLSVPVKSHEAQRLPLHATGVGKVLLAHAPAELRQKLLAQGLPRYTPHTIVMPGPLSRALAEIRRTGVSYSYEELTLGTVSVASPVRDAGGAVVAALSIVVRTGRVDLARLGPAVRTAALGISRENRERSLRLASDDPGDRESR